MTSYDTIYQYFINNIYVSNPFLPQTDNSQKEAVKNAVSSFNFEMGDDLSCDDTLEEVNRDLKDSEIMLIANYIKLAVLKNVHTYKSSIMVPYTKEVGVKFVGDQLKSAQYDIALQEKVIDDIIFRLDDSSIM